MKFIGLASDHAGFDLKCFIGQFLENNGYGIIDFGCASTISCDYADFAHKLGYSIDKQEVKTGFVFCGSGNGINMTINKHSNVRSALCWNPEIASLARHHNDANVCSIPARFVSNDEALKIVKEFLDNGFDGERHQARINKIPLS